VTCGTLPLRSSTGVTTFRDIIYHPAEDKFYITGDNSNLQSSDGGVTWSALVTGGSGFRVGATDGTQLTIAGSGSSQTTTDGITWAAAGLPALSMRGAWYDDGHFAFTSTTSPQVHWNTSGTGTWTSTDPDIASTTPLSSIFYIESELRWVTVDTSDNWYESTNLISWSAITSGDFFGHTGGEKVAADRWGYIMLQTDNNLLIKY